MKNLLLVFSLIFTTFAYSQDKVEGINFNQAEVIQILDQNIGVDQTCLDEYLTREQQLKKFLIWAPPATLVATPVAFMAGGYTAAFISSTLFYGGWDAIAYTILGAVGSGAAVIGSFITLETIKGIQFANMRKMTNLITASHANLFDSKALYRLNRRYNKKYPIDNITVEDLAATIITLDETGMLCDGEVRGNLEAKKLKHKLARRRDLIKYIHNILSK